MTTIGALIFFCLGAIAGLFYAMLASMGILMSLGIRDQGCNTVELTFASFYFTLMLFIAPMLGLITLVYTEPGPGVIGAFISTSLTFGWVIRVTYKRLKSEHSK
ncbi:hypothetical protein GCM10025856_27310 [Methylophaga marina]|uniref:Uncharacterized protein n=1 Tax=Methylophaga marina TaxID=45495 RepID=A0ABN0TUB7_9GAMM|nr:hypothetical protein [Methylophaga marina]BDZ75012.1 hypothetical protein GCM10025856_27310 [Methylophaga marina]